MSDEHLRAQLKQLDEQLARVRAEADAARDRQRDNYATWKVAVECGDQEAYDAYAANRATLDRLGVEANDLMRRRGEVQQAMSDLNIGRRTFVFPDVSKRVSTRVGTFLKPQPVALSGATLEEQRDELLALMRANADERRALEAAAAKGKQAGSLAGQWEALEARGWQLTQQLTRVQRQIGEARQMRKVNRYFQTREGED